MSNPISANLPMSFWRQYLSDLVRLARSLGVVFGTLMFLLALPGVIVPLTSHGNSVYSVPWFLAILGTVSALLCALAATLIFVGLRNSLYFSPLARLRRHRRR